MNSPSAIANFLQLIPVSESQALFETRMENDVDGNPLYVAWNLTPNAATSATTWQIIKLSYDSNGFVNRSQLPDNGPGFFYSWDNRATYFS